MAKVKETESMRKLREARERRKAKKKEEEGGSRSEPDGPKKGATSKKRSMYDRLKNRSRDIDDAVNRNR